MSVSLGQGGRPSIARTHLVVPAVPLRKNVSPKQGIPHGRADHCLARTNARAEPQSPFHSAERSNKSIHALRGASASGQSVIRDRARANRDNDGLEAVGLPELARIGPLRSVLVSNKRHGGSPMSRKVCALHGSLRHPLKRT